MNTVEWTEHRDRNTGNKDAITTLNVRWILKINGFDGEELITYFNQSPFTMTYLWLQLDENQHDPNADNLVFDPSSINSVMSENALRSLEPWQEKDKFGCKIEKVTNENGTPLNYTINKNDDANRPSPTT